jgi:hypothetical protein
LCIHVQVSIQKALTNVYSISIQIIQPTRCNSFTSLLLDVYVWLNMIRASPRPSSGAYNCTRRLWFNRWRKAAGSVVGRGLPDHDQQPLLSNRLNQRLLVIDGETPETC